MGWAPDPCDASGHLAFTQFSPSGKTLTLECGPAADEILASASSSTLFSNFATGVKGTYGATGMPGWGVIASAASGAGRHSHAMCGSATASGIGGIALCNGPGAAFSWTNHIVSWGVAGAGHPWQTGAPNVGCGGTGCLGPACTNQLWVWLK